MQHESSYVERHLQSYSEIVLLPVAAPLIAAFHVGLIAFECWLLKGHWRAFIELYDPLACAYIAYGFANLIFYAAHGAGMQNSVLETLNVRQKGPTLAGGARGLFTRANLSLASSFCLLIGFWTYVIADGVLRPSSYGLGSSSPFFFIGIFTGNVIFSRMIFSQALQLVITAASAVDDTDEDVNVV